jgi:hypothetical protein
MISATNTVINWHAAYNGGSLITSYTVAFRQSDGVTFTPAIAVCDGSDSTVIAQTECTVDSSHFTGTPFNLNWGESIAAKVTATNWRGDSLQSIESNSVQILRAPDSPISLVNEALLTTGSTIGFSWTEATQTGGTPVIDYRVSFDQGTGVYVALESAIISAQYTAVDLTPGVTYSFTVASRNIEGYSAESVSVEILAAQFPDTPSAPTTMINGDYVDISWTAP